MLKRFFILWSFVGACILLATGYFLLAPVGVLRAAPQAVVLRVDRLDDPALPQGTACTAAPNDCSLRGAVDTASNGDTLEIIVEGTIHLNLGKIVLTKDLMFTSSSSVTHIIDGGAARIFEIESDRKIILNGLTLQNAYNTDTETAGGAISMVAGTLTMTHMLLQDNRSVNNGGALSVDINGGDAYLFFSDVTFLRNRAQGILARGGAINVIATDDDAATYVHIVIEDSRFDSNEGGVVENGTVANGYGGALAVWPTSISALETTTIAKVEIRNTDFINNLSSSGGAVALMTYNRSGEGGIISLESTIYDSRFEHNLGNNGGALYTLTQDGRTTGNLTISNTTFLSNTATRVGGAFYSESRNRGNPVPNSATVTMHSSTFADNQALGRGGGAIYNTVLADEGSGATTADLDLLNVTISGNHAEEDGAAIFATVSGVTTTASFITMTHVTIFDNADDDGNEVTLEEVAPAENLAFLKNSIVASQSGTSCALIGDLTLQGANNLISFPSCGNSNDFRLGAPTGVIPFLVDNGGATATQGLFAGSSALNAVPAGECTVGLGATLVTTDQRGLPRPFGVSCDIGAFEVQTASLPSEDDIIGLAAINDGPTMIGSPTYFAATITSGNNVTYNWDFGDGGSGTGMTTSHTYATAGNYVATVTASNGIDTETTTTQVAILAGEPLPPVAANDAVVTIENIAVSGNVLTNDSDPQGSPLTVVGFDQPTTGTITIDASGHFTYTPVSDFTGFDSLVYTVRNVHNLTDTATLNVLVNPETVAEEPPNAVVHTPGVTTTTEIEDDEHNISIQIPGSAYSGTLGEEDTFFIVFTPGVTQTEELEGDAGNFQFAGYVFDLDAHLNDQALDSYDFAQPIIIEISYPESAVEGVDEESLTFLYLDEETDTWKSDGIVVLSRDTTNRKITFAISHLTKFALFAPPATQPGLYLPSLGKDE